MQTEPVPSEPTSTELVDTEPVETAPVPAKNDTGAVGSPPPHWVMSIALACTLFLIYAPGFTTDYLTNDEVAMIGRYWQDYDFTYHALAHGRPLSFYRPFIYSFVDFSPARIQFVRFLCFLGIAAMALLLFRFMHRASKRPWFSFFTILFLFSQLPFQTINAFSLDLVSFVLPTIYLSLTAFWLHFYVFPSRNIPGWLANAVVFLLLLAAMQSAQTWAFFAMAPVSFLALQGDRERFARARTFILLGAGVMLVSVPAYLYGLQVLADQGRQGYGMGEGALEVAASSPLELVGHALNPRTYWSAFKLWTYPYPLHNTPASEALRYNLSMGVFAVWLLLVVGTLLVELRQRADSKVHIVSRWLAALACMGFGAFILLAATPVWVRELRSHLTLVLSTCAIFIAAHALLTLSERFGALRTRAAAALGVVLVMATAFGAQSGFLRSYVDVRSDQLDFIRTELAAKPPSDYDRVVVVLGPRKDLCGSEPCDSYAGRVTHSWTHARRPERYLYAMSTLGIEPASKQVLVVEGDFDARRRDLVVDWNKYYRARRRYARGFRD